MRTINGWHLLIGVMIIGAISASDSELQKPLACLLTIYIIYVFIKMSK